VCKISSGQKLGDPNLQKAVQVYKRNCISLSLAGPYPVISKPERIKPIVAVYK